MALHLRRFNGKVAVCTGATKGIGLATARRLGEEGAKVVVSSRKQANVDEAVNKLKALNIEAAGVICHQGKSEDRKILLEHAVKTYGGIDQLYVNAGVNPHRGFFSMLKNSNGTRGGAIVTNSTANVYILDSVPASTVSVYALSKLAQVSLVKALAEPCAEKNIRINAIAPGAISTEFLSGLLPTVDFADEMTGTFTRFLRRPGEPEECAGLVAFLLSKDASYITGDCLTVCGGYSHRL